MISSKNKDFDTNYNLRDNEKINILLSLTADDCIKIEPNNNPRYCDSEVYIFIKCVKLSYYGEDEEINLYIKMTLIDNETWVIVVVISFHEEGQYE